MMSSNPSVRPISLPILIALIAIALLLAPSIKAGRAAEMSVRVLAVMPGATQSMLHQDGDALPFGSRYRLLVQPGAAGHLVVEDILSTGERKRLFEANEVTPDRVLQLPENQWFSLGSEFREIRVVASQGELRVEHVIRGVKSELPAGASLATNWPSQSPSRSSPARSQLAVNDDLSHLVKRVVQYHSVALHLEASKEPVLRGAAGTRVFRSAAPGVVLIVTDDGIGAGVIISDRGAILTNWHVIAGTNSAGVFLKPPSGESLRPNDVYEARVIRFDQVADLALLQLERPPTNMTVLRIGDERGLEVASTVHAIGHPAGNYWTYTEGVVSQIRSDYHWVTEEKLQHKATVIQTQTPINPGNSGGPLMDDNLNVIGLNSFGDPANPGLNFAVAGGELKRFLQSNSNRLAQQAPASRHPASEKNLSEQCKPRSFPTFVDHSTNKRVLPVDISCRGWPDLYLVGERPDELPEYALVDEVGDRRFDAKIIYNFNGKTNLWIFYGNRDGVPTAFGYDVGGTGKIARIVPINAAQQ